MDDSDLLGAPSAVTASASAQSSSAAPSSAWNDPYVGAPIDPLSHDAAFLRNSDDEGERPEPQAPFVEQALPASPVEPLLDTTGHDLVTLQDLVELTEVGARVLWPDGLNLLTARLLLSSARRAARQQNAGSAAAVPPVLTAGTSDLPQSVEPWTSANQITPSDAPT